MERRTLYAKVSPEAYEGFRAYCSAQGISLTALLEVVGRRMHKREFEVEDGGASVIAEARQVDVERARRPGPRKRR